jgi:hypothetical protein
MLFESEAKGEARGPEKVMPSAVYFVPLQRHFPENIYLME